MMGVAQSCYLDLGETGHATDAAISANIVSTGLPSGVVLHEPPFNLPYKTKNIVFKDEFEVAARSAVVVSTLYEL